MPAQTDGDVRRGRGGGGGRDKEALTNDDAGIGDEEREAGRATERRRARHEYIVVEGTEASGESSRRGQRMHNAGDGERERRPRRKQAVGNGKAEFRGGGEGGSSSRVARDDGQRSQGSELEIPGGNAEQGMREDRVDGSDILEEPPPRMPSTPPLPLPLPPPPETPQDRAARHLLTLQKALMVSDVIRAREGVQNSWVPDVKEASASVEYDHAAGDQRFWDDEEDDLSVRADAGGSVDAGEDELGDFLSAAVHMNA
mmetsp:Transcript_44691/g.71722  ORF Transcript_44691/g.71722 Transcript_44691/m.71722 type:complete len:257 (+) Transcript_44691:69-839(+)